MILLPQLGKYIRMFLQKGEPELILISSLSDIAYVVFPD